MIKKFLIFLIALIVLLVVGVGIFLLTFDLNDYKKFTERKLTEALNYPVQIGSMRTKLSLVPTIQINNFRIFQNGENPKVIMDVPHMEATVKLVPFLKKRIEIQKVNILLVSMDLSLLSYNESSSPEKKDKPKEKSATSGDLLDQLWIDEITVDKFLCRFMRQDKKEAVELSKFKLNNLNKFNFQVLYNKKKFDIKGSFGLLTNIISKQKSLPVDLTIKQGNASIVLKGQVGDLSDYSKIKLTTTINILKLSSFLKSWKIDISKIFDENVSVKFYLDGDLKKMDVNGLNIDVAKKSLVLSGSGKINNLQKDPKIDLVLTGVLSNGPFAEKIHLKPFELKTDVFANQDKISLKNMDFRATRSDFKGSLEIDLKNKVPSIQSNLTSTYLSLKDILQEDKPSPNSKPAEKDTKVSASFFNNKKLDWNLLKRFNIKGKISIDYLFLTDQITDYAKVVAVPQLEKGNLVSPIQGQFLSGKFNADIRLNADKKTASLKFNGENFDLDKVRAIYQKIKGTHLNTQISLDTKGDSLKELAAKGNGRITLELLGGTITDTSFNSLPSALNMFKKKTSSLTLSTSDQKTEIMCGVVNVPIKNGVITSDSHVVLQTDTLNFTVNGQVNLGNETLDLTIQPSINQTRGMANQLLNTAQAVHLNGPWKNYETKVDISQAGSNIVQIAANKLSKQKSTSQTISSTGLCQKALGKEIKSTSVNNQKTQAKTTTTKTTTPKKEDLKKQLMQSLTQVLISGNKK